jgi:Pectin methylesterase
VEGNRCAFINCNILGNQDTLYATGENSQQYYSGCYIEGTTDFIFGSATALFDSCTLHSKSDSYITAASTNKNQEFGFVFTNCKLTAAPSVSKVYLGRPWRDFAKVVFLYCEMGGHILPEGWRNWDNTSRDQTAYYAEYKNTGNGFQPLNRIKWSHQLLKKEKSKYTISNILSPCFVIELKQEFGLREINTQK